MHEVMPIKKFFKQWINTFQKNNEILEERQVILYLAQAETDRKYHCVRDELEGMKEKLEASIPNTNDYVHYKNEVTYLQQCLDSWQETLNQIAIWQKELNEKANRI